MAWFGDVSLPGLRTQSRKAQGAPVAVVWSSRHKALPKEGLPTVHWQPPPKYSLAHVARAAASQLPSAPGADSPKHFRSLLSSSASIPSRPAVLSPALDTHSYRFAGKGGPRGHLAALLFAPTPIPCLQPARDVVHSPCMVHPVLSSRQAGLPQLHHHSRQKMLGAVRARSKASRLGRKRSLFFFKASAVHGCFCGPHSSACCSSLG